MGAAVQLALLGRVGPSFDSGFARARRHDLGRGAWLDVCPGWVDGQTTLLEHLQAVTRWRANRRRMYDRVVDVPRLTAMLPEDGPGHPIIAELTAALSRRYDADLSRVSLAWYRDGRDSVAWHRDMELRDRDDALAAIVSLGGPRLFALRPLGGGPSRPFSVGWGDLVVMGGSCQRHFEHAVPKMAAAAPRVCIMFREA